MHPTIRDHFRSVDPILFAVIENTLRMEVYEAPTNLFLSLCREIIGQQLSGKAGDTIYGRFEALFSKRDITPSLVVNTSDETLRDVGMSWSKVRFIKELAHAITEDKIDLESLCAMDDATVITTLTKIKGIGPWTAEMFLMFSLGREDVFSHGDLGLRNAIKKLYGFKKEPTKKQVEKLAKKWMPYRTWACRILWKSLEKGG